MRKLKKVFRKLPTNDEVERIQTEPKQSVYAIQKIDERLAQLPKAIEPEWSRTEHKIDDEKDVVLRLSGRNKNHKNQCTRRLLDQLRRMKNQWINHSTCDPYIKLPIYGADYHVGFTEFDGNKGEFELSQQLLDNHEYTLLIQAFDSDVHKTDNLIGEALISLNDYSLIEDVPLFTTISITSLLQKQNEFTGKIEICVLRKNDKLEVSVLNATYLDNKDEYQQNDENVWLILRCSCVFVLIFFAGSAIFCWTESWAFSTSLWFLIVTTTTVGYGDVMPKTDLGKVINCAYLILSTMLLGWAFSIMMNYIVSLKIDKFTVKNASHNYNRLDFFKRALFYDFCVLMVMIIVTCLFFTHIASENWSLLDSLQWSIATISTVGYGEIAPTSQGGRTFAVFFMIAGIILLGRFATNFMKMMLAKNHQRMITKIMRNTLITEEQIAKFDVDNSGSIDKYEFITKMLILTNECEANVIENIMKRFHEIDVDGSGIIDVTDFLKSRKDNEPSILEPIVDDSNHFD